MENSNEINNENNPNNKNYSNIGSSGEKHNPRLNNHESKQMNENTETANKIILSEQTIPDELNSNDRLVSEGNNLSIADSKDKDLNYCKKRTLKRVSSDQQEILKDEDLNRKENYNNYNSNLNSYKNDKKSFGEKNKDLDNSTSKPNINNIVHKNINLDNLYYKYGNNKSNNFDKLGSLEINQEGVVNASLNESNFN